MRIAILTLSIGRDFTLLMRPGIRSKDEYAKRWGHDHILGGCEFHDVTRPVAWSKMGFWLKYIDTKSYDFLWLSDADSIITNPDVSLSAIVEQVFAGPKTDGVWWVDASGNLNSGQMLVRTGSHLVKRWIIEADAQRDLSDHLWWENMALIRVWENDFEIQQSIAARSDYKLLNAYYGTSVEKHWTPGCFVLHYAGRRLDRKWVNAHMSTLRPDLSDEN